MKELTVALENGLYTVCVMGVVLFQTESESEKNAFLRGYVAAHAENGVSVLLKA